VAWCGLNCIPETWWEIHYRYESSSVEPWVNYAESINTPGLSDYELKRLRKTIMINDATVGHCPSAIVAELLRKDSEV
jgi:hypothetical protein